MSNADKISIDALMDAPGYLDQIASVYQFLTDSDVNETKDLLEQSESIKSADVRDQVQEAIFARLGALSPSTALQAAISMDQERRQRACSAALKPWLLSDFDTLITQVDHLSKPDQDIVLTMLLGRKEITEEKRAKLTRGGTRLPLAQVTLPDEISLSAKLAFANATMHPDRVFLRFNEPDSSWFSSGDPDQVLAHIHQLCSPETPESARRSTLSAIVDGSPQVLLARLRELKRTENIETVLKDLLALYVEVDPRAAYQVAEDLDSEDSGVHYRRSVADSWAYGDPTTLLTFVEELPRELQFEAMPRALLNLFYTEPADAIAILEDIQDLELMRHAARLLMWHWIQKDEDNAIAWIQAQPEGTWESHFLVEICKDVAHSDSVKAFDIASHQSGATRTAMEAAVIKSMISMDTEVAQELLRSVDDTRREEVAVAATENWFSEGHDLIRIGNALTGDQQNRYYEKILFRWANADLFSLKGVLYMLPSSELRSKAARLLLQLPPPATKYLEQDRKSLYSCLNSRDREILATENPAGS